MPIAEKDFRELSQRVAFMEGALKVVSAIATIAIVGVIGWGWSVGSKVTAIEQQLADGGNAKLVAQLKNPQSPDQLKAGLSTVVAQVQTARAEGKPANTEKVKALSNAVSQVIKAEPQLPEAWSAAAQLVSYKTQKSIPDASSLPRCEISSLKLTLQQKRTPSGGILLFPGYSASNCTLYLEELPEMTATPEQMREIGVGSSDPRVIFGPMIRLSNGVVVYNGGPLKENAFLFENCVLDFNVQNVPFSSSGKNILIAALENPSLIDTFDNQMPHSSHP